MTKNFAKILFIVISPDQTSIQQQHNLLRLDWLNEIYIFTSNKTEQLSDLI